MKLSQIKKVRVYEQVIEQIKDSIEKGLLRPGDKLPSERELAVHLSISRSVVREAMSVLNASGVLDIRPGVGVFLMEDEMPRLVQRMNRALKKDHLNLLELLEVRQGLEVQAAYLAAQRADEKDIAKLSEVLKKLDEAVSHKEIAANEDFAFHVAIAVASKNETIVELLRMLSDRFLQGIKESRSQSLRQPNRAESVLQEHYDIYHAIVEKDAERARAMMIRHLENVKLAYEKHEKEGGNHGIHS